MSDADVVVTMLFDTDAVEQTMTDALDHVPDGAVWVQGEAWPEEK